MTIGAVEEMNARFSHELWLDFEVISIVDGVLTIFASGDFCYYHQCEITFTGVRYFHGPKVWGSDPPDGLMRVLPDIAVCDLLDANALKAPCIGIEMRTDTAFKVLVVADAVEIDFDTVYHYEREDLGPNERINENVLRRRKEKDKAAGLSDVIEQR